jgi:hypothetical protein
MFCTLTFYERGLYECVTPTPVQFSSGWTYNEYIQFVTMCVEQDAIKMASHGGIP